MNYPMSEELEDQVAKALLGRSLERAVSLSVAPYWSVGRMLEAERIQLHLFEHGIAWDPVEDLPS